MYTFFEAAFLIHSSLLSRKSSYKNICCRGENGERGKHLLRVKILRTCISPGFLFRRGRVMVDLWLNDSVQYSYDEMVWNAFGVPLKISFEMCKENVTKLCERWMIRAQVVWATQWISQDHRACFCKQGNEDLGKCLSPPAALTTK